MRALVRRIQFLIVTIWAALTINFILPRLMPGSPVDAMMARFRGQVNPSALRAMQVAFGTNPNGNFWSDYIEYLGNMLRGRFGISVVFYPTPVSEIIRGALPWTLGLIGVTTVIAFLLGTLLGMRAAWRRQGVIDTVILPVSVVAVAFPYFWIGMILIYFFATKLHYFPAGFGYDVLSGQQIGFTWSFIGSMLKHAILPGLSIVLSSVGGWLLLMRNNMIGSLSEDYVRMARAKGLPERRIMFAYAGRNAILPSITGFALAIGFVVSGALLVEVVFNYPGLGFLLYQAVTSQDFPLMQAIFLMVTVAVLVAAALADLANAIIDPRVRESR
jgi:peptide/nickel transport system permease protein